MGREIAGNRNEDVPALVGVAPRGELPDSRLQHLIGMEAFDPFQGGQRGPGGFDLEGPKFAGRPSEAKNNYPAREGLRPDSARRPQVERAPPPRSFFLRDKGP